MGTRLKPDARFYPNPKGASNGRNKEIFEMRRNGEKIEFIASVHKLTPQYVRYLIALHTSPEDRL